MVKCMVKHVPARLKRKAVSTPQWLGKGKARSLKSEREAGVGRHTNIVLYKLTLISNASARPSRSAFGFTYCTPDIWTGEERGGERGENEHRTHKINTNANAFVSKGSRTADRGKTHTTDYRRFCTL